MQFTKDNIYICITEKQVKSSEERLAKKRGILIFSRAVENTGISWEILGNKYNYILNSFNHICCDVESNKFCHEN